MSDRELLELAAKAARAAGLNIIDSEAGPQIFERMSSCGGEIYRLWFPRESNGDAFVLMVALRMSVDVDDFTATQSAAFAVGKSGLGCEERFEGDGMAATRLAILKAAAEIGKAMP